MVNEEGNPYKGPEATVLSADISEKENDDSGIWNTNQLASPPKRFQGQFIDGIISVLLYVLSIYVVKSLGFEGSLATILMTALPILYFVFCDGLPNGQSLGKKWLKMSVINKSTGEPCTYFQSLLRNVLTPFLGWLDAILIFLETRQRLGDHIANTVVIKK